MNTVLGYGPKEEFEVQGYGSKKVVWKFKDNVPEE